MGIQINGQTDTISATDGSLNIGGTVTVNVTGDATGLTGTPNITVGVVTASSAIISGDLTVNGTTTTLDTTLTEVDKLEVGANNTTVGVAITQSGSGDILRLYDGATQVVTVKDGGSVGIGTDNPTKKLEVAGNEVSFSPNTAGKHTHLFTTNASDDGRYLIKSDTTTVVDIQANGSSYFNGGNIGIGTDNPQAILDVEGTLVVGTSGVANGNTTLNGHVIVDRTGVSGSNPSLSVYSSGSSVFYVNGGGSVYASGVNATGGITAGTSGQGNGNSNIYGYLSVDRSGVAGSNTWFQVKNGSTPILYADGNGNIGIGTDDPDAKLHLYQSDTTNYSTTSDQRNEAELRITNPLETSGTFSSINFYNGGGTGGDISLNAVKAGNYASHFTIKQRAGGGSTDWRERLRITSSGNVGISSATPNDLLDVNGGSICKTGTGSNYSPHIIVRDKAGRIKYFEYYFNCVKGSNAGTATDAYILDITSISNFFQASFEVVYGTRLQSVSDATTSTCTKTFGVNRFIGNNVAVTDENNIEVDANSNTHADVTMDALSSSGVRLKVAFSSTLNGSSFCSGVLRAWGVNDVLEHESYQTLTFYNGV